MNYGIVFRLLAVIVFTLASAFLICFGVSFLTPPTPAERDAQMGFLLCTGLALVIAMGLRWLGRGSSPRLFRKEALCAVGLGWIIASAVGALPYAVLGDTRSYVDAFFEAASGLTTTGSSIYTDVERLPRSLLFWRALSQWIGGMGVVVFFVAILGFLGAGARVLYANEASGSAAEFDEPRVQSAVLNLWLVYLGLSLLCALTYVFGGMSTYDAFCHMFATVSTGGFSTHNLSFAAFASPFLEWSAIVFMVIGGTNFVLLSRALHGRPGVFARNTEWRAYIVILVGSTLAITPFIVASGEDRAWLEALRAAAFQVASITTTSGFASVDFNLWQTFPKVVLLALMIVGGCSGSTAGGLKVARVVVAWRVLRRSVEREYRPHVIRPVMMNRRPMEERATAEVLVFIVSMGLFALLAIPVTAIFEPNLSFQGAVTAVLACLFNLGPGFAEVGPMASYAELHDYTKLMLAMLMIMGRLELFAVLALFTTRLWKKNE